MTSHSSSDPTLGCLAKMLALAGILLIIAGGLFLYPVIRDELRPLPAAFGEAQPLLRSTVTPVQPSQTSQLFPDTLRLALTQTGVPLLAFTPNITASAAAIPTRLVIPAIGLDAPIEAVGWTRGDNDSTWNIPNYFAAGWLKTSAPAGRPGNTVLEGHHNMAGEVFRDLVDLEPGDMIVVHAGGQRFTYAVTAQHILPDRDEPIEVRRQNARWIQPTQDERLTLVTCWPYTNNTHRLIVVAKPIAARNADPGS